MKKFFIHTMGCKSNQFESFLIIENLVKNGYEQVKDISLADIFVLNSCSVTHKSDNEAFYLLRNAKHKKNNIVNVLTGCVAQIESEKLLNTNFVDYVVGNDDKFNLAEIISRENKLCVSDIFKISEFNHKKLNDMSKTRASLKIQDGCDCRCSYCIIPFARGKNRSAKIDFVINEIKNLEEHGFKEVVFTGIHIGQWGKDFGLTILDLLKAVEENTNIERYRLGSLNPLEITDDLLDFLVKSNKFCPHFHLSLQSACDKTLKNMNRFYKVDDYLKLIEKINDKWDLPFLGSDIIAGFSGESDEDFQITVENLKKSGLTQIHTFPYSQRLGTVGANMPNQVEDCVKNKRAEIIKTISKDKYIQFIMQNLQKNRDVLIEKHLDKNLGILKGVTRNYITVYLNSSDENLRNTLQEVKLTKYEDGKVYGELL